MAYDLSQRRAFARELARSGGNVASAARALRENYETFRELGDSTLHRFLKEPGVAEMIAEEGARQREAAVQATAEVERARIKRELMGSELDRLARDEAILDDMRNLVKTALEECRKEGKGLPVNQIGLLYERITRIHDARRNRTLPAVADTRDASILLKIFAEESLTELGSKAQAFMKRIRDRYIAAIARQDSATEAVAAQ